MFVNKLVQLMSSSNYEFGPLQYLFTLTLSWEFDIHYGLFKFENKCLISSIQLILPWWKFPSTADWVGLSGGISNKCSFNLQIKKRSRSSIVKPLYTFYEFFKYSETHETFKQEDDISRVLWLTDEFKKQFYQWQLICFQIN